MSSDQELLHAYGHHHDEAAFTRLVERHAPMVLATCRRITRDHHDAEDAAQATFIVLASKASQLRAADFLAAWLHRVACYIATRQRALRTRRRRVEIAMSGPLAHAAASSVAANPILEEQASWSHEFDAALAMVPVRYRQPLILHYLEGRSCNEIASLMAISEDLVASRLSRGRERLRHRLRPASTLDVGLVLAAVRGTEQGPGMTWQPNQRSQALANTCVRAMWLIPAAITSSVVAVMFLLMLGLTWGYTNAHGEDTSQASEATTPPSARRQPRLSVALCQPWQEQLLVALERRVTMSVQDRPALAIIDSIGRQCGVTMVADFPHRLWNLPNISIDARGIPLQQLLNQVAQLTNTSYQLYAGSLLWREAKDPDPLEGALPWQRPENPVVTRLYRLHGLANGLDGQTVMQDLEEHAGVDMFTSGRSPEILGDSLLICASPADHLTLEAYLATRWRQIPPLMATSRFQDLMDPQDAKAATSMAQARILDAALTRALGFELHANRLRAALAEISSSSGVVIECEPGLDDPLLRHRPIPALLARLAVRDAIALTLDGTGFHGCMRVGPSATAGSAAVLVISRRPVLSMVTVGYHCAPIANRPGSGPGDPSMLIMAIEKTIAPGSWSTRELEMTADGAREYHHQPTAESCWSSADVAERSEGWDLAFTHCLEVQLEINAQAPLLAAAILGVPLPAARVAPLPLRLQVQNEPPASNSPIIAPQQETTTQRL